MTPHVTKTEGLRLSSRCTTLFKPYSLAINAASRFHGPFTIGTEADTTPASRAKAVSGTTSPPNTPTAQVNDNTRFNLPTTADPSDWYPVTAVTSSPAPRFGMR